MNDLFDQQITDGLHRAAAGITVHHGSLPDVRRRVRARRARHVAAVSLPAVAGLALVGLRQTPTPSLLSPAAAPEPTTVSSDPGPDTGVPTPSSPTSTTTVESTIPGLPTSTTTVESTMSAYPIDGVVCLDATPDASAERCLATLPGARTMTAPSYVVIKDTPMFVVPADPAYQAEAQALSDRLGLPFRPDITGHFQQDLAGIDLTGVRVFVVLGTTDTTVCTIPGCDTSTTPVAPLTDAP